MINRISVDSEAGIAGDDSDAEATDSRKYQSTKKWEWSYLRVSWRHIDVDALNGFLLRCLQKECDNLGLDLFYRTYIHRMQRSFLSLVLIIQAAINISHIVLLMIKVDDSVRRRWVILCFPGWRVVCFQDGSYQTVIPDVFIYSFSLLVFIAVLLPAFSGKSTNTWRPFVSSFLALFCQIVTGMKTFSNGSKHF